MKIIISKLKREDVDDVVELEKLSYGEHHWSKDSFLNELTNSVASYYAARNEDGELVGYIGIWSILDEGHITTLSVSPKYRRMHIGETLIQKIIDDCYYKLVKYITLEVRVSNIPAISLYEKYDFKSLGTRKGYYQDNNEDALIMWTENIFSDKFKKRYQENKNDLLRSVEVECINE